MINLYDFMTCIHEEIQPVEITLYDKDKKILGIYNSITEVEYNCIEVAVTNCFTTDLEDIIFISAMWEEEKYGIC